MSQTLSFPTWYLSGSGWSIRYSGSVTISVSRSYGSDTATVSASGWMNTPNTDGDSNASWKFWIKIGSSTYTNTFTTGYHAPGTTKNFSYSWNVSVGATGGTLSGQAALQAYDDNNGFGAWSATKDWSQSYGTKGASTIASAGNVSFGTGTSATSTVTFTSYSSSFTHKIKATLGNASTSEVSVAGGNNVSKSGTLTFGTGFISAIPNAKSGTATVYLYTYSGSTLIGTSTKSITVTVPTNINPTISNIAGTKVSALSSTYFSGKICTLIDKLQITWSESLKYSATVSSREITAIDKTYNSASGFTTDNALATAGSNSISVKVNDSRGNSGTATGSINVYNYFYPSVDVKYNHSGTDYKLIINCRIAYVGNAQTTKQLRLAIYKGETAVSGYTNINLDSAISTVVGDTDYTKYYDVNNYEYTIPTAAITDIETDTYKFVVTATDTVTSSTAQVYSGITVMTLEAGGTGVIMRKPVTFEQGVNSDLIVLNRDDTSQGGIIYLKGAGSHADAHIEHYNDDILFHCADGTGRKASINPNNGECAFSNYYHLRNGVYTQCYPPEITQGSIVGSPNTDNVTSWWVCYKYSDYRKMIWATATYYLQLPSSYGALYFSDPNIALPTSFFSEGYGNLHWIASARSNNGLFSTNVHQWNASTGAVAIFVGSPVKPTGSNTWSVQIELWGIKF